MEGNMQEGLNQAHQGAIPLLDESRFNQRTRTFLARFRAMVKAPVCKACQGTGRSTRGQECYPCCGTGSEGELIRRSLL